MSNFNRKNVIEIVIGIIFPLILWIMSILGNGEVYGGDVLKFSSGSKILSIVSVVILGSYGIVVAAISKIENRKALFISSEIVLGLPFVSFLITMLVYGGMFSGEPGFLQMLCSVFLILQMPMGACVNGFSNALGIDETVSQIYMSVALFILLAVVPPIVYRFCKVKKTG